MGYLIRTRIRSFFLWVFGRARWLLGATLFVLGAIGALMGIPDLNAQLRSELPGLRCWVPVPMAESKFTVAMSPFVTVSAAGKVRATRDGRELAQLLFANLESSFAELDLGMPYELRSPDQGCLVKGRDREQRAANAESWAEALGADVLIYGAIVEDGEGAELQPEFYVAYRGFSEATDLAGPHELGRPVRVSMPVEARDMEGVVEHPVNVRAKALSLIALGLAGYAVDDYEQALERFSAAAELPNWPDSAGKELIYLLLGNTSSNLAATSLDNAYVDEALDYYDQALRIRPDFARALAGQAAATYQLALGDLQTRRSSQVDTSLLDESEDIYRRALQADAPEAAEISLKVHFGLGQIYLVRHYLQLAGENWLEQARAEFQTVVDAHAVGEVRNLDLVGHAYARLGLIAAQLDGDPETALSLYEEAAALASPRWQAQYQIDLGDLLVLLDELESARDHFEEALSVAELYGNAEMVARAEERLSALP